MAAEIADNNLEFPVGLTDVQLEMLRRRSLSDPLLSQVLDRLFFIETMLHATIMDVARRHGMAMEEKSRGDKFESQYNELKMHLDMYKEQWKRSLQKDGEQLHEEFKQWKWRHLNDEVTDVSLERDEALAANAHMRACLKRIVEHCSWTRDEQDPLVTAGLIANEALKFDVGDDWVSPKDHKRALHSLRCRAELVAVNALSDTDDQLRVASAIRAVEDPK